MRKPRIKKGMNTFLGCYVDERRVGTLKSLLHQNHDYIKLENQGFLKGEDEGNRRWFSLTQKGKDHIRPRELFYAVI